MSSAIITSFAFVPRASALFSFFFFNDTATTEIYTLSLHDALPILDARPHTRPQRTGLPARAVGHGVRRPSTARALGAVLRAPTHRSLRVVPGLGTRRVERADQPVQAPGHGDGADGWTERPPGRG